MEEERKIMDFLSDKMTEVERESFLKEMESDSKLKASVDHSRYIRNILSKDRAVFSEAVRDVIYQNKAKNKTSVYWIAASVFFLIAAFTVFIWRQQTPTLQELADSYIKPHNDILSNRAKGEVETDLSEYNNGDYQEAVKSLQRQLDSHYNEVTALYLGVSYLLADQPVKANDVFSQIDTAKVIFSDDVNWYKSLALIKLNRQKEAKALLILAIEENTVYRKKAEKLIEMIQ